MSGTSKKILLVEDEPIARTVYQNRLKREGFEITFAEDGEQALDLLSKMQPDLVTLDLMLPKVNGAEVLKHIRSDERLKNTPVLVISNAYMTELSQKAIESGATRGMSKTECTPAKLVETARDMMGLGSAFDLSDKQVSEDEQAQAFAAAAEAAMDDELTLKETREEFLQKSAVEVARIRESSLAYIKAGTTPESKEPLNNLYQQVRFFATRAGLSGCIRIALLSNAFEALLFETLFKPAKASPSAAQTVAQAVDCLERFCQDKSAKICEAIPKAKILVVDDDAICNYAVVSALKRAHFDPESSEDPLKALKMAEAARYDVVFLDINMPGLNGFEVCERLRALPDYKETPVIFITSNADFQNRAKSILSGGNDFIPKPVSPVELVMKTTMRLLRPQGLIEKATATTGPQPLNIFATKEALQTAPAMPSTTEVASPSPELVKSEAKPERPAEEPLLKMAAPEKEIELLKPASEIAPPKPVEPEKVALAEETAPKETPVNGNSHAVVEALHMAKPGSEAAKAEVEPPRLKVEEEVPKLEIKIEPPKAEVAAEPPKLEVKVEPPKAEAATEVPKLEVKLEEAKPKSAPAEPEKPVVSPEASKEAPPAPVEVKAEPEAKTETPAAETISQEIPLAAPIVPPVSPIAPPLGAPEISHPNNNTTTMENKPKTSFDEAARGVARIIFGDENISDMNVRLTRIALEKYNVPGTHSIGEIARGVAQIIFGDENTSDMNVRLTRIALERYNIAEILGAPKAEAPNVVAL
jgi:putative two-component system response regulator